MVPMKTALEGGRVRSWTQGVGVDGAKRLEGNAGKGQKFRIRRVL